MLFALSIGSIAIAPSDPTTVYVGTGEAGGSLDSFFLGVGIYRITNADTTPVVRSNRKCRILMDEPSAKF